MDIAIIASLLFVIWRITSIAASVSGRFRRVGKMVSSGLTGRLRQRDAYHLLMSASLKKPTRTLSTVS